MASPLSIKPGDRFGSLICVEEIPAINGMRRWRVKCSCGNEIDVFQKSFASGGTRTSCGCTNRQNILHGLSKRPEYRHWVNMISRCENPNTPGFKNYGGRGIRVCERWRANFENFFEDMGERPSARHSLDRVRVNGHYQPNNCRWVLPKIQCRNTRTNHIVVVNGWEMTLAEAVETAPVPYNTVLYRLKRGWTVRDAISRHPRKGVRP